MPKVFFFVTITFRSWAFDDDDDEDDDNIAHIKTLYQKSE